jgi:NAD(P)-dependent dehydrogenase (short-subunit alcohol dehydrogenase family)
MGLFGAGSRNSHHARAVVTGAGSGIGRAFATELARRGGHVVCADIDEVAAKETVRLIEVAGGEALAVRCDVSVESQVWDLAEVAEDWFGQPPSLVVNNAGIGAGGRVVGETSLADWRSTIGVNMWGVVHGCHVFVPWLRAGGGGGIINVASAAGFAAGPRMAAYNASKAAVMSLSETLAAELAGSGVTVTVLCPTFVKTNIVGGSLIDPGAARLAESLMRVTGYSPERVARDRGRLYVLPQLDAKVVWRLKRLLPAQYAQVAGLIGRLAPNPGTRS